MERQYAEGTSVSVVNSRLEIEKIILKYAGQGAEFAYFQREGVAEIVFAAHGRRVRFTLPKNAADGSRLLGPVNAEVVS